MVTSLFPPWRCDNDGNLYFPTELDGEPAIRKLNQKGERVALFQTNSSPDIKVNVTADFALVPDGSELYQLVYVPGDSTQHVMVFKSDGSLKSIVKLDPGFHFSAKRLAIFSSGQFLISGEKQDANYKAAEWPFTGIFAADGTLLKELKLKDDKDLHDLAASGDPSVTPPGEASGNLAIDLGFLQMGEDGNAYLIRWGNPAIVYAISAGGRVVRRFKVAAGESEYRPIAIQLNKNRIAILFWDKQAGDEVMKILDLEGHEVATYDAPKGARIFEGGIGPCFACYTQNPIRFVFLGHDQDHKVQFLIAEPR
jgi:hypothetical protein